MKLSSTRIPSLLRSAGVFAAATLAGGCVTGEYQRVYLNEPRPEAVVRQLAAQPSTLRDCLDALGAPNAVWPTDGATAMAWAHTNERGWGVRVSATVENVPGSVTYASALAKAETVALFFDDDWNLLYLRRGKLIDLLRDHPRRVQPVGLERDASANEGPSKPPEGSDNPE